MHAEALIRLSEAMIRLRTSKGGTKEEVLGAPPRRRLATPLMMWGGKHERCGEGSTGPVAMARGEGGAGV